MRKRTTTTRRRGHAVVAVVATVGVALAGCTSSDSAGEAPPQPMSWQRLHLPGGLTPVTLTPMGDRLLVGARVEAAQPEAKLLLLDHGDWTGVPLRPDSYYASRARWRSVVTDGHRIFAFGDAPGGAHSNPRWTTWAGTIDGVREYPQFFETFGGWGAGGLTGMTLYDGEPLIIGSWSSESVGLDITEWTADGNDWSRRESTGTALASSKGALNVIRAVGQDQAGIALAGAVVKLADGEVTLQPALWRRTISEPEWIRFDLPAVGAGEATGVRCSGNSCLAAGYVDDRLAVWSVDGGAIERVEELPVVKVARDSVAFVGTTGSGGPAVLATSAGHSLVLSRGPEGWVSTQGPVGTASAWTSLAGRTYVVTSTPDGGSALWAGRFRS